MLLRVSCGNWEMMSKAMPRPREGLREYYLIAQSTNLGTNDNKHESFHNTFAAPELPRFATRNPVDDL